jgi:hypothetical protein
MPFHSSSHPPLVESRFRTLGPLRDDGPGLILDLDLTVDELVSRFVAATAPPRTGQGV